MGNIFSNNEIENESSKKKKSKVTNYDIQREFLEELLKISKVDVNDPDIIEMRSWVKEKLWKAVEHLKGTKLEVADLVLCGSMAEGTRVFELDVKVRDEAFVPKHVTEFDFMAVFKMPVTKPKEVEDTPFLAFDDDTCKGHMTVIDRSQGYQLYPKQLRKFLRENVLLHLIKDADAMRLMESTNQLTLDDSVKCSFLWKPGDQRQSSNFTTLEEMSRWCERDSFRIINVDLMPAFLMQESDGETPRYLVPKSLCDHDFQHFLESYCRVEIQALLNTSQVHRDVYMLLKSFNNHVYDEYKSPSYYLKTAVLHHIKTCTEPDLVFCNRQIIQFLCDSYKRQRLLTFKSQINLLSYRSSKEISKTEYLDRLKQIEKFFGALLLFEDGMNSSTSKFNLIDYCCGRGQYIHIDWRNHIVAILHQ